jgi:hypothetical protein
MYTRGVRVHAHVHGHLYGDSIFLRIFSMSQYMYSKSGTSSPATYAPVLEISY